MAFRIIQVKQMTNQTKIIFLSILISSFSAFSQKDDEKKLEDTKTLAYGVTTNNYSSLLGGVVIRSSTPFKINKNKAINRYLALEAVNLKNPREKGIISAYGTKFIFGKTNYLFSLRPEYGREFYIFDKAGDNSIGFSAILAAGPSFGLQKPYYIKYINGRGESPQTVPFNADIHTDIGKIVGAGNILQGFFSGLKVIPGAHVKAAANLDMNSFNNNVTGFEIGTVLEFFVKEPEIIASKFSKNPQAFTTVYLTLYFGNKKLLKNKKI